ncbi:hypothetical protein GCM10010862_52030 [Devosia nitrariae]|uniref:Glycosyltransferase 2-like domain-containing protein n=2 Tax=Devosia nitrariae TaxID=2071872 RepID=A0ABQ5WDW5_9HYPH|nr:hypothetical protein GCM10010862_52030 [Devosia nitrariae]
MVYLAQQPRISIGIPTYVRTTYIGTALESCFSQTFSDYEIIVHDDTQDESIKGIVESYGSPRLRYVQNTPPLGLVSKLNDLLTRARGQWLVILCDDDAFEPGLLEELLQLAQAHPYASLLRSRNRLIDEAGRELTLDLSWPEVLDSSSFLERLFLPGDRNIAMNLTGMMFRPAQLQALGGFVNLYRAWHVDRLAWAQLGAEGPVVSSPNVLCNIRIHEGSITSGSIPDYGKALESDLVMKGIVERLIANKLAVATSEAEKQNLHSAGTAFAGYLARHMSRSLDHGLLAALASPDAGKQSDLLNVMAQLNIPSFSTERAYRVLRHLPLWARKAAVACIYRYKQHWFKRPAKRRKSGA